MSNRSRALMPHPLPNISANSDFFRSDPCKTRVYGVSLGVQSTHPGPILLRPGIVAPDYDGLQLPSQAAGPSFADPTSESSQRPAGVLLQPLSNHERQAPERRVEVDGLVTCA